MLHRNMVKLQSKYKLVKYQDTEEQIDTFIKGLNKDKIFGASITCGGRSIFSEFVKFDTNSPWSHSALIVVGIVKGRGKKAQFQCRQMINQSIKGEQVWVIEAAKSFYSYQGDPYDGIHLIPLKEFLFRYDGDICIQEFNKPMELKRKMKLCRFINKEIIRDPKFDLNPFEYIHALLRDQYNESEDTERYFCSEFNAKVYKVIGLLPRKPMSSSYVPSHFFELKCLDGFVLISIQIFIKH